jgi:acetyltransferase-like isoleucine patch superfamily enzyme
MNDRYLPHDWYPQPLPANVELGENSWLYSAFAFRHYQSRRPVGVRVGRKTGLYHGTFFDLGPSGELSVGDYCTLVGAIVCSDRRIVIGDYVFVAHEVVLADSACAVPHQRPEEGTEQQASPSISIEIADNAWIGARAIVLGGARIGEGAIVGAAAVIDFEVPPYSIAAGNPARIVGSVRKS